MTENYDFVIVGGGSAGCVLAARLSEDSDTRVCLLEAGGRDIHPLIHIPVGFAKLTSGPLTWGYVSAPQKHANQREIAYAQGRVLGGSSSINAEIYTRGHPSDYDRWAEQGAEDWGFATVREYFLRSEGNAAFSGDWHGVDGPLGVSSISSPNPLSWAFVQSCQELGIPHNADFNGARQEGSGIYQTTIRNNRRCSAAVGYLHPVGGRKNLTVKTKGLVRKILFEGNRAIGIEYLEGRNEKTIHAESEILITAGAIGSPKLMMLSGVGPAQQLQEHGIKVVQELSGVGQNLQDHFGIDIVAELQGHQSLDKYNKPHWMLAAGAQYALFKSGPFSSNVVEAGAFWYSDRGDSLARPDLQFHFLAGAGAEAGVPSVPRGASGITLNSYTLRPKARGKISLRSANPHDAPIIDPNFLGHPDDLRISTEGVKISREIFSQKSLQKYIKRIHFPDDSVLNQADFEDYARKYGRTSYHPTCTCKMGTDETAVVDPQLRVHGLENIRICDSSVFPSLIGSNTNAATMMIAERASDFVRGNR